jgi:hypothetical protein
MSIETELKVANSAFTLDCWLDSCDRAALGDVNVSHDVIDYLTGRSRGRRAAQAIRERAEPFPILPHHRATAC